MLEEVATFVAVYEAALETRHNSPQNHGAHIKETCRYCIFEASCEVAFTALAESADPLVRWIAQNCEGYAPQAAEVLRLLPAPMAALDALACENEWCEDWANFRAQAKAAGVLPASESVEVSA